MEENVEMQEVLIARNKETGETGAVVGQNADGSLKTADAATSKIGDLMKFSKEQNPLEAFIKNFIMHAQNPSLYEFFRLDAARYDALGKPMTDLIKDADANKEMLKPYKVDIGLSENQEKKQSESENSVKPESPDGNVKSQIRSTPVDADAVDWARIEKEWGVTREELEKQGALNNMLYNHKSPGLVAVRPSFGGETFEMEARLSFKHNPDGSIVLSPHFIRKEPQLDREYKGYTFSAEDKAALKNTGNLGKTVDLLDPKTGQPVKSLVSIDRITNEIESVPVDKVYIRNKVANVELSMHDIGILKNGGLIKEQHIELPNGRKFTADLQYNAERRDVEFVNSQNYRQQQVNSQFHGVQQGNSGTQNQNTGNWLDSEGNPKRLTKWCGIPLDEQKQAEYMAGKKIYVGETKDNKGNDYTLYMQFDPKEQRPKSTRIYPDRDKVVGIANESKTQVAVNNEGKTNEATKNIQEPLKRGQTVPEDSAQQKEQKKARSLRV